MWIRFSGGSVVVKTVTEECFHIKTQIDFEIAIVDNLNFLNGNNTHSRRIWENVTRYFLHFLKQMQFKSAKSAEYFSHVFLCFTIHKFKFVILRRQSKFKLNDRWNSAKWMGKAKAVTILHLLDLHNWEGNVVTFLPVDWFRLFTCASLEITIWNPEKSSRFTS